MKKLKWIVLVAMIMTVCSGCGTAQAAPLEPSVTVDKKGTIESTMVESFEEDYYNLSELQDMVSEEVSAYNSAYGEGKIVAKEPYMSDENVVVTMTYASYTDYNAFNERDIFVGTIPEAIGQGIQFQVALESVKEPGNFVSKEQIEQYNDRHLMIVDEPGVYNVYGTILYVSDGVSVIGKKSVNVSEDMEGIGYILFR